MEKLKAITSDTLIPLSILGVILGGVVWLTTLHGTVFASNKTITEVKEAQAEYTKNIQEVRERLIRIEETLKYGQKK